MSEKKGGLKPIPPVIMLGLIVAALGLHYAWDGWPRFSLPWVGWLIFVAGFGPVLWVDRLFKAVGTTIKPSGLPTTLVTHGPFRFSRNPIYLSSIVILFGLALAVGTPPFYATPILMAVILHLRFIPMEEANLAQVQGQAYVDYKVRVRRWI